MADSGYEEYESNQGTWVGSGDSGGWWEPNPVVDPITNPTLPAIAAPAPAVVEPVAPLSAVSAAYAPQAQTNSPYRIETRGGGGGGDSGGSAEETVLVDQSGNVLSTVQLGDDGKYSSILGGSGDSGSSYGGGAFTLEDIIKQSESEKDVAFGTGRGQAVGYAYELKNEDGEPYQRYDAQGNLTEFLNRVTGEWNKASDVKPIGTVFDPTQGKMVTQYQYGDNKFITVPDAPMGTSYAPVLEAFSKDTSGMLGEGGWSKVGALVAVALSAGIAGGALSGIGLGTAPGTLSAAQAATLLGGTEALTLGAVGTSAAQGALAGVAISGAQGASPAEMLKAGLIGGIAAGGGSAINLGGLGTVGGIAARTGLQTGLTAISGGNVEQALVSGLISSTLPIVIGEVLPSDTMSVIKDLPKPIQNIIMSTASSVLKAGFNGQDLSDAAVSGVTNGMISLGKDFAKGAFNSLSESELATTIKDYFKPSTTAGGFVGEYQDAAPYDPNLALDQVIQNLPQTNTTVSAADPYSQDSVMAALTEGYQNAPSTTGLPQYASAITSDANQPSYGGDRYGAADTESPGGGELSLQEDEPPAAAALENAYRQDEETLRVYNQVRAENGLPPLTIDDADFLNTINRINDRLLAQQNINNIIADTVPRAGTYNPDAPIESPFQPRLPASEYDPAIKALEDAGLKVSYKTLDEFTQDPGALVDAVYPALAGRQPTEQERTNFIDQYSNSATASPQDLLKDIYDKVQLDKQLIVYLDQSTSTPVTPAPPLTSIAESNKVEPEKVDPDKAQNVNAPKGGSGTQGGSLAGDQGRVGAANPASSIEEQKYQAIASESQSVVSFAAESGLIDPVDIPIVTSNLTNSSSILGVSPADAVQQGLVQNNGTLSDQGVEAVANATGLTKPQVIALEQGSSTIEQGSGSSLTGEGAGGAKGTGTGVAGDQGLGGTSGTNVGGTGTGVGTGVGSGEGSGTGTLPSLPSSYGASRLTLNPQFPGALPGSLEGTYLKGADVEAYDPFENYNIYQQIAPVRAAQGGSPLQLAQLQQGIYGVDPRQYSVIQNRPAPSYFTYGKDTSQNAPTVFAGSQLTGKPRPNIPVTPTGNIGANDWMYGAAGSNQLSPAGASIPTLPSGMMADGGMAHGGMDEDEHIPEFITGLTGHYVKGRGDGQSDDIPAMLADGEYVFDAETVAQLGNGSSDAGAEVLDKMREAIRRHKRSAPLDEIPPKSKSPLEYLAETTQGKRT